MNKPRLGGFLPALLIALAGAAAYANTFRVPFLLDDQFAVTENASIKNLQHLGMVLSPNSVPTAHRPLLNLTYALNYAWSGQQVWSYHLVNLLIHILAGLTLFGIVRRTLELKESSRFRKKSEAGRILTNSATLALAIALIWTVHPLQTESVTYISERAESLMGLFYLLTLYCFIRSIEVERAFWYALSVLCCLLGMATKETMVTAPVLVILYDRAFRSDSFRDALTQRRGYYLSLCFTWLFLGFLMWGADLKSASVGFHAGVSWSAYALTETKVIADYLKLSFWPHPLVFDYGKDILLTSFGQAAPYALLVAAMVVATVITWRRSRPLGFLAAAFFILLSPTSSIVPVAAQPMAESRMYLPLAAVVTLAGLAGYAWGGRKTFAGLALVAVALAMLTVRRNDAYRSPMSIWEDTVASQPGSARGQYNLANELAKIPDRALDALAHYEQALRIDPNYAEAHNNLGDLFYQNGRISDAFDHYLQALRIRPDYAETHRNLGNLFYKSGRLSEAIDQYRQAIRLGLDSAETHDNLGIMLGESGRTDEALEQFKEASRLKPGYAEAHNNLGLALYQAGRIPEAIDEYRQALRLGYDHAETYFNLALALEQAGRPEEAAVQLREALRVQPDFSGARQELGRLDAAR